MSPFFEFSDAPAPGNASCACACDDAPDALAADARGFYTTYTTAARIALLLAFAAVCVMIAILAIVFLLARALLQLDRATAKLRSESLAEVRGGLLPCEGGPDSGGNKKAKRAKKKERAVQHYEYDEEDEEHRL